MALIRAPHSINKSTISVCPSLDDQCSGLNPWSSLMKKLEKVSASFRIPKITTWNRVLEKLTVPHLAKEFLAFHHSNTL